MKKKGVRRGVFIIVSALVYASCNVSPSQIGSDFFRDGSLDFSYVDTPTVRLSTVQYNDFVTNQRDRVLLGTVQDEKLGRITAAVYLQADLDQVYEVEKTNTSFDRISLVLRYDSYSYYDTTNLLTLNAYALTENIELPETGVLYDTDDFAHGATSIGSLSFRPKPNSDSIEIVLPSALGEGLFQKVVNQHEDVKTNEKFIRFIKGFFIVPDTTTSSSIIGFSSSIELRLYYEDRNVVPRQEKHLSFTSSKNYTSTRIFSNRSGTKLTALLPYKEKLPSSQTDNEAYIQAGAGLALRIDIPHLRDLKQPENFFANRAILEIYPVRKSFGKFTPLPEKLDIHVVNKNNSSYNKYSSQALLVKDLELGRDTHYEVDATSFVKSQMEIQELNEDALLFTLEDQIISAAERIYFASPSYEYNTRLKIYYTSILD